MRSMTAGRFGTSIIDDVDSVGDRGSAVCNLGSCGALVLIGLRGLSEGPSTAASSRLGRGIIPWVRSGRIALGLGSRTSNL